MAKRQTDLMGLIRYLSDGLQLLCLCFFGLITMIYQYRYVNVLMRYYFTKPKPIELNQSIKRQGKHLPPERRELIRSPGDSTGCNGKAEVLFFKCQWLFAFLLVGFNPVNAVGDVENLNAVQSGIFTGGMESVEGRRLGEQKRIFIERTSGFGILFGTKEDCEEGAGVFGWSDTTAETERIWNTLEFKYVDIPLGCVEYKGRLLYNTKSYYYPGVSCSSTFKCLFKLTCQAGTYQDQTGESTCKTCATGRFSSSRKSSCDLDSTTCPKGTIASGTATACTSCAAGKYNDATGKTACKTCVGFPNADQSACLQQNVYGERTSGLCTDGGSYIGTKEDCSEGSDALEWSALIDSRLVAGLPAGCYLKTSSSGSANGVYFNTKPSPCTVYPCNRVAIGTAVPCTSFYKCLCKVTCLAGTYQDQTGQTTCKPCAPGLYNNHDGRSSCQSCATGQYSTLGKPNCDYEVTTCPKGTYASGKAACTSCVAGKYNDAIGQTDCKTCTPGKYNDLTGQISESNCKTCASDKEPTGDQLACVLIGEQAPVAGGIVCQVGTYQDQTGQTTCKSCKAGQYNTQNGRLSCEPCATGTYTDLIKQTSCKSNCIAGSYIKADQSACLPCPQGKFQNQEAKYSCIDCGPGKYNDQTGGKNENNCRDCKNGKYNSLTGQTLESSCKDDCTAGSYIPSDKSSCTTCPEGQYQDESNEPSCKSCVTGKYSDAIGQPSKTSCKSCMNGKYTDETGQASCKDNCNAGSYILADKSACSECDEGRFQDENSQLVCRDCVLGQYSDSPKQISCKHDCSAGSYITSDKTACSHCAKGKWQNLDDQSNCIKCLEGTYNDEEGRSSLTDCLDCAVGRYNDETGRTNKSDCRACPKGYEIRGNVVVECTVCGYSKYQDEVTKQNVKCKTCPVNTYITDDSKLPAAHEISGDCIDCTVGKFAKEGDRVCDSCAAGQQQIDSECENCVAGKFSVAKSGGSSISCENCKQGYYQDQAGTPYCLPCLPGSFQLLEGEASCNTCPPNTKSEHANSTKCDSCDPGEGSEAGSAKCQVCEAGMYSKGVGSCTNCDPGQYRKSGDVATSCTNCDAGQSSDPGSSRCQPCEAGTYSDKVGQDCGNCDPGQYRPSKIGGKTADPTKCLNCEIGYTSKDGASSCDKCGEGSYGSEASVCTDCPAGYYQDFTGELNCKACPIDTYLPSRAKKSKAECQTCSNERTTNKIQGATSSSVCVCSAGQPKATEEKEQRGYYAQEDQCVTCPSGASCNVSGANLTFIQTLPTYWRSGSNTDTFFECVVKEDCIGGLWNQQCRDYHTGPLCSVCIEGHVRLQGKLSQCQPCSGDVGSFGSIFGMIGGAFKIENVLLIVSLLYNRL